MWSSNFSVEVAVKFGVLLVVLRNETRKNPSNLASCSVLTCAFDAKKIIEKENGWFINLEVICVLLHPPYLQLDLHL